MAKKEKKQEDWNWSWPSSESHQSWIPGVILVFVGAILLLRNFLDFEFDNWWAFFILIPAITNFVGAYQLYRETGEFSKGVRSRLVWGLIPTLIAFAFFFNADWGLIWPAMLIIGGLGLLLGAY
jgi:uncharacterized membrane protein YhaH (DUF805 family)